MIYKLIGGTRVRVTPNANLSHTYDFEVYRFDGVTGKKVGIDSYTLSGQHAEKRINDLRTADAIRFGEEFGGGGWRRSSRRPWPRSSG